MIPRWWQFGQPGEPCPTCDEILYPGQRCWTFGCDIPANKTNRNVTPVVAQPDLFTV